ncbi:MAG TPA: hypothetical protein QGF66_00025 [SAR86 cluster bacterium]|jgi:hypothetical protein|nr:hypothetical protein [SAR86 cluster bacterium]|tara:strand:+ start:5628 stop:5798 length:171 start_codon:yes stop_codon:yes gene_type:complete
MGKVDKKELELKLRASKLRLYKLEDEHGLNFWTGSKRDIDALKAEIYDLEEIIKEL